MTWEKVGKCGVDSGQLIIIDPCYISDYPEFHNDKGWDRYCKMLSPESNDGKPVDNGFDQILQVESGIPKQLNKNPDGYEQLGWMKGNWGEGVISSTGMGDGTYPVYADIDHDGRIMALKIDFMNDDDEDDEYDEDEEEDEDDDDDEDDEDETQYSVNFREILEDD